MFDLEGSTVTNTETTAVWLYMNLIPNYALHIWDSLQMDTTALTPLLQAGTGHGTDREREQKSGEERTALPSKKAVTAHLVENWFMSFLLH